jgi:hypothetical protein
MSVIETTATEALTERAAQAHEAGLAAQQALAPDAATSVPAVVEHQALAIVSETNALWQLAERVARTEMVPADLFGRPEAVFATVMYGRELGLGPMQSLQSIHFIKGKPSQSADLMRSTIRRHGHIFQPKESTNERCVIYGKRADTGEDWTVEWTIADATTAGLLPGKPDSNWRKYPRAMLFNRATSELAKMLFSECLSGVIYTPEELEDVAGGQQQGQARQQQASPFMSENNQRAFVERATAKGLDAEALAKVVHAATEGRTDKVEELHKTDVSALRTALEAWQPIEDAEVVAETPPPAETNQFATAGRQAKARKIADWLIANEVEADDSLVAATPEERRAIGESAGVANKAGTPPSDETWALVIDLVRQHQPATAGDAFQGVAP